MEGCKFSPSTASGSGVGRRQEEEDPDVYFACPDSQPPQVGQAAEKRQILQVYFHFFKSLCKLFLGIVRARSRFVLRMSHMS